MAISKYAMILVIFLFIIGYYFTFYRHTLSAFGVGFLLYSLYVLCEEFNSMNESTSGGFQSEASEPLRQVGSQINKQRTKYRNFKRGRKVNNPKNVGITNRGNRQNIVSSEEICELNELTVNSEEGGPNHQRNSETGAIPKVPAEKKRKRNRRRNKKSAKDSVKFNDTNEIVDPELREYFNAINSTDDNDESAKVERNDIGRHSRSGPFNDTSLEDGRVALVRGERLRETVDIQPLRKERTETAADTAGDMGDRMRGDIGRLIAEAKNAIEESNEHVARRKIQEAVVRAQYDKDQLILYDNQAVTEAYLAQSFGDCAFVSNQLGDVFRAARCFYTATVFETKFSPKDFIEVSEVLWSQIFSDDFRQEKCSSLLVDLDKLARLAESRSRWQVCHMITEDALKREHQLVKMCHILNRRCPARVNPVDKVKRSARCLLQMGHLKAVQALCIAIQTQLAGYDDMETFEIWAKSLLQDKKYDIALTKVDMALKQAKTSGDTTRLEVLKAEIESKLPKPTVDHQPDPSWLPNTCERATTLKKAASTSNLSMGSAKKSKTRHKRPKARDRSKYDSNSPSPANSVNSSRASSPCPSVKSESNTTKIYDRRNKSGSPCPSDPSKSNTTVSYDRKTNPRLQNKAIHKLKEQSPNEVRSRNSSEGSTGFSTVEHSSWADMSFDSDSDGNEFEQSVTSSMSSMHLEEDQEEMDDESSFYEQTCRRYAGQSWSPFEDQDELSDEQMMSAGITLNLSYLHQFQNRKADEYYSPMLSEDRLKEKLLSRPDIYKRCSIQIEGCHVSYCHPIGSKETGLVIEISGRTKAGQTYNDDEVVVELLDKPHENKDRRYGKVIGILERNRYKDVRHPVFICSLDDMDTHHVRPLCKTVPKMNILNKKIYNQFRKQMRYKVEVYTYDHSSQTLSDDPKIVDVSPGERDSFVFLVAMIGWTPNQLYPHGAIIRMLKSGDTVQRGLSVLSLKHKVPALYNKRTFDNVEGLRSRYQGDQWYDDEPGRRNLCHLNTFTIDPPGSQDLDDALSVEAVEEGYKVGIHIADVSAFVRKDDPIDIEAHNRAVTYYPSIRRPRNMLPEPLSSNLCSLLPNQQRRTISVFFLLNNEGRPVQMEGRNYDIVRSAIQSKQRFTYGEVQDVINNPKNDKDALSKELMILFKLATKIRKRRLGAAMFALDVENDEDLTEDSLTETLEAHYLVEEFMIMANKKIAEVLVKSFPDNIPIRCQAPPTKESMEAFLKRDSGYIDTIVKLQDKTIGEATRPNVENVRGDTTNRCIMISKTLWEGMKKDTKKAMICLKMDDLFPMQHIVYQHWISMQERAEYKCSDSSIDSKQKRHFSLDIYPYTHFTSPIRRYNDLVIHRLLIALLTGAPCPYSKPEIEHICAHVNATMRRAKEFQRGCKSLQQAIQLKSNPQMVHCFVDEPTEKGLSLCAPDLRHVEKREKQLPFNLLDMSRKPELIEDVATNYDRVKAVWRKRIYNTKCISSMPPNKGNIQMLDPDPGVVSVPLHSWASMLQCVVDGRQDDISRTMKYVDIRSSQQGLDDVSTESLNPLDIQPNTVFSLTFKHGQTLKVQISSVPHKGILAPRLVLYSMTNNVKLCLQHTDDPVLHLSRYTTKPTSKEYKTVQSYVNTWLPIILMESAVGAVSNEECCIINDVQTIRFDGDRHGKIVLPLGYCEVRNIDFSGIDDEDDEKNVDQKADKSTGTKSYDWLCLKFTSESPVASQSEQPSLPKLKTVWVGHAEITCVKRKQNKESPEDGKITVSFVLHEKAPTVPQEARQKGSKFTVEVICKSEVDRRTESYIKRLISAESSSVAMKIALNTGNIPKLDPGHAHLADLIEKDLYIERADFAPLPPNNKKQQEAIDNALTNRFSLIQGPPGTGKSYTGIKLMCLFDKINDIKQKEGETPRQVLFCGPSNKSVDLVARWMLNKLGEKTPKFLRVYGRSIEAMDFPIPGRTFLSRRSTHNLKADEQLKSVSLHHLIRQKGEMNAEEINMLDRRFKANGYAPDPANVKKYVHLIREASIAMIRKYDVILCTTAVGSNPKVLEATRVFQVIVDEAGMCPEPQCLVPILATAAEQVVLIGDHKQLRPIIMCKEAAELGLDQSLFERYASNRRIPFTMLELQYRMNPEICRFPSEQFYDGKLETRPGMWDKGPIIHIWPTGRDQYGRHVEYPHVLVHVEGEEKVLTVSTEEGNEQSKSNQQEIDMVVKVYKYLIENEGLGENQINVMSQYNAQVTEIKRKLAEEQLHNYIVSTVVSSQGGEWDYVIFSTVRSLPAYKIEDNPTNGWCQQNLGFITDKNQINVALTRARKGLIIIGNTHLLKCDKVWRELISDYEHKGCLKTTEEFPPKRKGRQHIMNQNIQRNIERYGDLRFERGSATSYEGSFDDGWSGARGRGRRTGHSHMNEQ